MIVTPNSEIVQNASKDPELKSLIASADLIIPDGIGLVYASKLMGCPLSERVTGIDFLESIIRYLSETGESIFFFGSKPGVADAAAEKMKEKYPGLNVAGTHHGYFQPEEEEDIVRQINHGTLEGALPRLWQQPDEAVSSHEGNAGRAFGARRHRRGRKSRRLGRKSEARAGILQKARSGMAVPVYSAAYAV